VILNVNIAPEKTGTTSIQRLFAGNRPLLAEHGILYPRTPGPANHLALATYAHTRRGGELWHKMGIENLEGYRNFRAALRRDLGEELASAGPIHKTIMSNEHCSSRLKTVEEVEDLREFLSARRIHFLLAVHQAVAGDAEDDVARRRAQIGQPPVDQVERPGQGRVAGRVGGQILPSERQHADEFRNLLAGSGGWHTAILAARTSSNVSRSMSNDVLLPSVVVGSCLSSLVKHA